jgi:hypothetical protein
MSRLRKSSAVPAARLRGDWLARIGRWLAPNPRFGRAARECAKIVQHILAF